MQGNFRKGFVNFLTFISDVKLAEIRSFVFSGDKSCFPSVAQSGANFCWSDYWWVKTGSRSCSPDNQSKLAQLASAICHTGDSLAPPPPSSSGFSFRWAARGRLEGVSSCSASSGKTGNKFDLKLRTWNKLRKMEKKQIWERRVQVWCP